MNQQDIDWREVRLVGDGKLLRSTSVFGRPALVNIMPSRLTRRKSKFRTQKLLAHGTVRQGADTHGGKSYFKNVQARSF
jgi:hypothetical protein